MNDVKIRDSIKTFLQKMRAVSDEIPEELANDALEMTEEVKDALEEEVVTDEDIIKETVDEEIETEVKEEEPDIKAIVKDAVENALKECGIIKDEEVEKLDELTKEIGEEDGEIESEEAVTIEPEKIADEETVKEVVADIKPIIAGMKDKKAKKMLTDSIIKLAKMSYKTSDDYGTIMKAVKSNKHAMDTAPADDYDYGKEIAKKYNPHYKEDK